VLWRAGNVLAHRAPTTDRAALGLQKNQFGDRIRGIFVADVAQHPEISTLQLTAYSAPSIPLTMLLVPLVTYLPAFYAVEMRFNLGAIGVAFLLGRLIDGFADPLMGLLSDRTKARWGRRAPWLVVGTPILMLATYELCMPSPGVTLASLTMMLILFYLASTVVQIPYYAWGAEISSHYTGRNRVSAFREAGFVIGMVIAVGLPGVLLGTGTPPLGQVLVIYSRAIVVLLPITVALAVFAVNEYPLTGKAPVSFHDLLKAISGNKPLQAFLAGYLVLYTALSVFDATVALFFTFVLKQPNFLRFILIQYLCSLLFMPLAVKFGNAYGKHVSMCVFAAGYSGALLAYALMPAGAVALTMAVVIVKGASIPFFRVMPTSIIGDLADYYELKSGVSLTGIYMSLLQVATKVAMATGIGVSFPLLAFLGFDVAAGDSDVSRRALITVSCVLPLFLMICSTVILWRYPITKKKHNIIRKRLLRRARAAVT
jgi:GPH family glycoside/pentoside/hexuronide:cation symporter